MVGQKVLIGYVTGEYARRADFYDYINLLKKPENCIMMPCHDRSPAKGRNLIIEQALEHECTHVLFVDDDMTPRPDALERLLAHDVDIVSALYLRRAYPHQPLVFDVADEEGKCLYAFLDGDTPKLLPIVAAGFGFLLMKTRVFGQMEKPWVRLGEIDAEEWCDDIGFFKRIREAGFESFCDTECRVGHIGTQIIWPVFENNMWFAGCDTNGMGTVNIPLVAPKAEYKFEEVER